MKRLLLFLTVTAMLFGSACTATPADDGFGTTTTTGSVPTDIRTEDTSDMDFTFSDRDENGEYDDKVTSVDLETAVQTTFTAAGTYVLTGKLTDKMILIDAGENDKIQLVLDNVTLENSTGPAIYIRSADKVFLTLKEGTTNRLADGSGYTYTDGNTNVDGAIFSRADLTVNGSGNLTLVGNTKHGIVSKDDLVIASGTLTVTAANVGLNGKDCVKIGGATVTVNAGSDGIRSDNTEDATRGYVYLEGGVLNVTAGNDGTQAETVLKADNVTLTVKAGSGSGGYLYSSEESYKGLKAGSDIQIAGGLYTVDSQDDCLHSNNTVTISGGTLRLASGDDGVHADNDLSITGGNLTVSKSYEGLEASRIVISGGELSVTASDDGLNAAGGNDRSGMGGRPGMGGFDNGVGEIYISGGYLLVDALGDGIDSNGSVSVSGGVTLVSGPTNNGNGAFDYGRSASVTGGILVALGTSGMAQGFSSAENQGAMLCNFSAQAAETLFAVCDANGTVIASFIPPKAYQSAVVTAPSIQVGENYTLYAGGTASAAAANGFADNGTLSGGTALLTVEMTSTLYNAGGMMGGGPGGMMGGGFRPGGRF